MNFNTLANATAQIQSTPLLGDGDGDGDGDDRRDSWVTTVGKFRFLIEELPPFLQFTYELLKVTSNIKILLKFELFYVMAYLAIAENS